MIILLSGGSKLKFPAAICSRDETTKTGTFLLILAYSFEIKYYDSMNLPNGFNHARCGFPSKDYFVARRGEYWK